MVIQRFSNKWLLWLAIALLLGAAAILAACRGTPTPAELPPPTGVVSAAAKMIAGTGGYDYGEPVANSIHTQFGVNCMNSCHMAPTLGWANEVGAEAYKLTSEDGMDNVELCDKCHPPDIRLGLNSFNNIRFNRLAIGDYDGNGLYGWGWGIPRVEGVQDEVQGLLDVLLEAIQASGVERLDHDPYWENVTTTAQKAAIENWSFVYHDGSLGVHNTARSVQLLQRSYKNLTGQDVPGAELFSPVIDPEVEPSPVTIEPVMEIEGVVDEEGEPIRATALDNVGTGCYVLLKGFSRDIGADNPAADVEWTLYPFIAFSASSATLTEVDEEHVYFVADTPGWYKVKLAVTDSEGVTTKGVLEIHSASYVGVGDNAGGVSEAPKCSSCHPGMIKTWAKTGHASTFTYRLDGAHDPDHPPYNEDCLTCHTLGYNPLAKNDGYDDVAADEGWTLPEPGMRQPDNWDAAPIELKQMASVQCESCHGPGDRWIGATISLSAESCGYCHRQSPRYEQWGNSGHADATSLAFTYPIAEGDASCMPCHSAEAFIDATVGKVGSLRRLAGRTGFQTVTCAVCHDPHSAEYEAQLRVYDTITLPGGVEITNAGASAACMMCHNGRVGPDQVVEDEPYYPHYSTAAEMLAGTGGYDYGEAVDDSAHKDMDVGCVDCHMAPTPGWVDDERDGEGLPGHDEVGAHTFKLTSGDGVENIAACADCHADLEDFDRIAAGDYDGDNSVEGIQDEVQGLLDVLLEAIQASGVERLDHDPYWENVTTTAQKAAIYNWIFVCHDGSLGIHNTARSVQLLQRSYKNLTGQDVPGADLR